MSPRLWIAIGAAYGFLGVALGAFGAHALRTRLTLEAMSIYRTGIEYHFTHALALLALGIYGLLRPGAAVNMAGACFSLGILLFSGSLYALALTDVKILGAITPIGGLLFMVGWAAFVWSAVRD